MSRVSDEEINWWAEKREGDAGRLARKIISDRGALVEKDREIERLKEEGRQAEIVCDSYAKENQQLHDRMRVAEARLAAMGTVTEADVAVALDAWHNTADHRSRRSEHDIKHMRAALNATIASKRAASDQPAEPERTDCRCNYPRPGFLGDQNRCDRCGYEIQPADANAPGAECVYCGLVDDHMAACPSSTPAPPSDAQAGGAEGDAAFVERMKHCVSEGEHFLHGPTQMSCVTLTTKSVLQLIALASRPASSEAVRVLVEALEAQIKVSGRSMKAIDLSEQTIEDCTRQARAALAHPSVLAVLSGTDPAPETQEGGAG